MFDTFKRLSLGLVLIAAAAGVLLLTDRGSCRGVTRAGGSGGTPVRVALVQHASIPALDEGVEGALAELASRGYEDGGRIQVKRYNSEADIGTANAIAREVTGGGYDLIVSVSTVSLQTIANANRNSSRTRHVFGLVSDPFSAGVGIDPTNGAVHPPYMTGYGSMQPVARIFRAAREMRPELRRVGLAWNPAEANSLAQTKIARAVCEGLGIELVEANAENSSAAMEAVNSLISREIEAIWISGDITIGLASKSIITAATRAQIPVFASMTGAVRDGTLFDLGANYVEVGRTVGALAADVLDGKNPADLPVENRVPEQFLFNETVPPRLKDRWFIPPAMRKRANGWITATETNLPAPGVARTPAAAPAPKPAAPSKS